jgi:hypothetical protein
MTKKEQNEKIAREMRQHVASWQAGKMISREYCADNGLAVHKLYYWLNKIKKEQAGTNCTATGFLRVQPGGFSSSTKPFRLHPAFHGGEPAQRHPAGFLPGYFQRPVKSFLMSLLSLSSSRCYYLHQGATNIMLNKAIMS